MLTDDVVRDGSFDSVAELVTAIDVHLAHHNLKPTPYRGRAEGAAILEKSVALAPPTESKYCMLFEGNYTRIPTKSISSRTRFIPRTPPSQDRFAVTAETHGKIVVGAIAKKATHTRKMSAPSVKNTE